MQMKRKLESVGVRFFELWGKVENFEMILYW